MRPMLLPVTDSVFDLFKIGPGPSSSHTIGPMRAANDFLDRTSRLPAEVLERAERLEVRLFGSLSATGKGHGSDRAVVAGLLGQAPETCPAELLESLEQDPSPRQAVIAGRTFAVSPVAVVFDAVDHTYPFANTLLLRLLDATGAVLFEQEYYSVGGGFIQWKGWVEADLGVPPHAYGSMAELKALCGRGLKLHEMLLANEKYLLKEGTGLLYGRLDRLMEAMEAAVTRGLAASGPLPGPIGLRRKAKVLYDRAARTRTVQHAADRLLVCLNAFALAAAEENAAGHTVVTAPTSGASGVIPAVLAVMRRLLGIETETLRHSLLVAGAVGLLARHNASISGAEVGCQGEVGVASAMAAAMLAYAHGGDAQLVDNAAEIALEHHLGLTCDPVGGYVQIPCIERNAMGAVKAYNAFLLATVEDPGAHMVDFDKVLTVMAETGRDMCPKYRETAAGGLARHMTTC